MGNGCSSKKSQFKIVDPNKAPISPDTENEKYIIEQGASNLPNLSDDQRRMSRAESRVETESKLLQIKDQLIEDIERNSVKSKSSKNLDVEKEKDEIKSISSMISRKLGLGERKKDKEEKKNNTNLIISRPSSGKSSSTYKSQIADLPTKKDDVNKITPLKSSQKQATVLSIDTANDSVFGSPIHVAAPESGKMQYQNYVIENPELSTASQNILLEKEREDRMNDRKLEQELIQNEKLKIQKQKALEFARNEEATTKLEPELNQTTKPTKTELEEIQEVDDLQEQAILPKMEEPIDEEEGEEQNQNLDQKLAESTDNNKISFKARTHSSRLTNVTEMDNSVITEFVENESHILGESPGKDDKLVQKRETENLIANQITDNKNDLSRISEKPNSENQQNTVKTAVNDDIIPSNCSSPKSEKVNPAILNEINCSRVASQMELLLTPKTGSISQNLNLVDKIDDEVSDKKISHLKIEYNDSTRKSRSQSSSGHYFNREAHKISLTENQRESAKSSLGYHNRTNTDQNDHHQQHISQGYLSEPYRRPTRALLTLRQVTPARRSPTAGA